MASALIGFFVIIFLHNHSNFENFHLKKSDVILCVNSKKQNLKNKYKQRRDKKWKTNSVWKEKMRL